MKSRSKIRYISMAAVIAALYAVLTYAAHALGLASGNVQCRLSESLLVLPMFTSAAIPGLFIGCLLSNVFTGCMAADIIFGSIATLIGALCAYALKNKPCFIATLGNVAANTVIVPFVLKYAYGLKGGLFYFFATVGAGEIISCTLLGAFVYGVLKKHEKALFKRL